MIRGERRMGDKLDVKGEYIMTVFDWYWEKQLVVNRKYQRKLVWSLEEKQAFIESLLKNYPVPLFILVECAYQDSKVVEYEIIDGLQRLEAITSFILNKFPVNVNGEDKYFDVTAFPTTLYLYHEGKIRQREPKMDQNICKMFGNYMLPVTKTNQPDTKVEEIFCRINSTGRKLSPQDLRQAGALGLFTDVVRKIAENIRGDQAPSNKLLLNQMSKISLSNNGLKYGLDIHKIYWIEQSIITYDNLRASKDEELISQLLNYIIFGSSASATRDGLDRLYDRNSTVYKRAEEYTQNYGTEQLVNDFMFIFREMQCAFESVNKTFAQVCFKSVDSKKKYRTYQAIFLALYDAWKNESKQIGDYKGFIKSIENIGDNVLSNVFSSGWNRDTRNAAVSTVRRFIEYSLRLVEKTNNENNEYTTKLEQIIDASRVEQQLYDFKQGVMLYGNSKGFNDSLIEKIAKTLVAMANTSKEQGYVIIGVSDTKEAADEFDKNYGTVSNMRGDRYINGVEAEASKNSLTLDRYILQLKQRLEKSGMSASLKDYVLRNFRVIDYKGKSVIMLTSQMQDAPADYNKEYYVRYGSSNKKLEIGSDEFNMLFRRAYM